MLPRWTLWHLFLHLLCPHDAAEEGWRLPTATSEGQLLESPLCCGATTVCSLCLGSCKDPVYISPVTRALLTTEWFRPSLLSLLFSLWLPSVLRGDFTGDLPCFSCNVDQVKVELHFCVNRSEYCTWLSKCCGGGKKDHSGNKVWLG